MLLILLWFFCINFYFEIDKEDGICKKCLPNKTVKIWLMFNNGYKEINNQKGYIIYKTRVIIYDFSYSFLDDPNTKIQFIITQKRVIIYYLKLARKQLLEIQNQEHKTYSCCLSKAKKEGYGEKVNNILTLKKEMEQKRKRASIKKK